MPRRKKSARELTNEEALRRLFPKDARDAARKEAQLALAGKYKEDPDLMRICEDAYRQRGRPLAEGE